MAKRRRQGKGQPLQSQNPRVDETTRIRLKQILQEFWKSNEKECKFDATLSKNERALVHQMSRKMGMKSKSSGTAKQRQVFVFKTVKKAVTAATEFEKLPSFEFSEEAQAVLGGLFSHHPPSDRELLEDMVGRRSHKTDKTNENKDDAFSKPSMSKAEITKKLEAFSSRMKTTPQLQQIAIQRSKLPIAAFKDVISSAVESHQVVLISGETGCGKTTQVPQYILDHMWSKGEVCKVVCTQPRRISAMSVAERIASERGETIGESIGYKIRLESKGGKHSSVLLCTTGILLRVLCSFSKCLSRSKTGTMKNGRFGITHIIMDEIHERDRYSDFMMAVVRDMLPSYPHLRLILMSATIDAERFSQYFGGCPVILVPGFTHPVRTFFLEDVLSFVRYKEENHLDNATLNSVTDKELSEEDKVALDEVIHLAWSNDECDPLLELVTSKGSPQIFNYRHSLTGLTPLMVFAGKGRVGDVCMMLSFGADFQLKSKAGTTALEIAELENQQETADILKKHRDSASSNSMGGQELVDKYLTTVNPDLVDIVLIEQLIRKICMDSTDGGILIFLPGWDEINRTREKLLQSPFFNSPRFIMLSLHSMVPSNEQRKVFVRPPPGCRKIILSTNIAETAVTIDDIVYVIDTGRMKEKSYDPYSNVQTLQSSWVSKASAKQREGRAGRCQPGICYHLYSKNRAASLPDFQVPELRRMPVEELCLQVKMIDPSFKIEEYLSKTLDPPVFESIRNAIIALQDIGALSTDEELTELGEKLGSLPVHPLTSKLIFFAILMNCLDPALTLACASDYRNPFTIPMSLGDKKKAAAARSELASLYGGCGDQLAVIAAFECWHNAKTMGQESWFCSQYFVSRNSMNMLHGMRKQLQSELIRIGLIQANVSRYNVNSHNPGVIHAILVAGLYPMVGTLITPKGTKRVVVETASGHKVRLHQHSVNYKWQARVAASRPLIVLDEITRGDGGGMCTRNCTLVGPLPLLLLSAEIAVAPPEDSNDDPNDEDDDDDEGSESDGVSEDDIEFDNKLSENCDNKACEHGEEKVMSSPENAVRVIMDRWLYFGSRALDVAQLYCLRERLSAAILRKVSHPREPLPPTLGASVNAIEIILSSDGLLGLPAQLSDKGNAPARTEAPLGCSHPQASQKMSLPLSPCRPSNGNLENRGQYSQHVSSRK